MVEKVINAEYILLAGTDTALDYIQYQAFRGWRDLEEFQEVSPEAAPKYTAESLKQLRSAHDRAKMRMLPDGSQKHRFGKGHDWIDIGLSKRAESVDKALREKFSMRTFKSTRVLYHSTYKKSAGYLHGMFESLVRSLESEQSEGAVDEDGKTEMSIGIRIKDKDPRIAVEALKTANLAAFAMILFVGKIFNKKQYLEWISSFKVAYLENRRRAQGRL